MTNRKKSFRPKKDENSFFWLKNNLDFEIVYKNGQVIISDDKKIKAKYLFLKEDYNNNKVIKAGLSVISKKGNSVWRNRFKRILREILSKDLKLLSVVTEQKNASLQIIFSPYSIDQNNSKKIYLKNIEPSVLDILNKLLTRISTKPA